MMGQIEKNGSLHGQALPVERVQIGARMEKNLVKVLKALAEYFDISLGDLLEGIVLHAFEQKHPFGEETLKRITQLKEVYGMDYDASASHRFIEQTAAEEPD
ncbi:hypothetical protein [Dictyobacter kobayashii]|uniref:HTH cro/C1-type domain-containing protein n=1 Tax=Dictyobacter kobayashii TaxID=2014872 RepID=A0A402ARY3_9CHLR|nr:hypothetical protein [Dictyobacter kobayashii]GCE21861.1 hypothetical protein KDK_56610 [Dictyobacter kobayashii]